MTGNNNAKRASKKQKTQGQHYTLFKSLYDWQVAEETEEDENGREVSYAILGTSDRTDTGYIIEPIYTDILAMVLDDPKSYVIRTEMGHTPILTISCDNQVIIHSPEAAQAAANIRACLKEIEPGLLFSAGWEIRLNQEHLAKKGTSTQIIISTVANTFKCRYPASFITTVLFTYVTDMMFEVSGDDVRDYFRNLRYEELLEAVGEIRVAEAGGKTSSEFINRFIKANPGPEALYELERIINEEAAYRLYTGAVRRYRK